jgi:DNA repair protein RadC
MTVAIARDSAPPDDADDLLTDAVDADLVAALVRQGDSWREARDRAARVMELAGGPWGLARMGAPQLASVGLSSDSIGRIRAAITLGARVASAKAPRSPMDAEAVYELFLPLLLHLSHEEMHVVLLDQRGRYRSRKRVASGGIAACSVYVKDILAPAVELRCPAMVIVHNHPSGASRPSSEDISLTIRVLTACDTLGVRLVDHLVIAEDGHRSAMPGPPSWHVFDDPTRRLR